MENQSQGWLRGAIIAGAIVAAIVYLTSRRGGAAAPATGNTTAAGQAGDEIRSSELGRRAVHVGELLVASVADEALQQVKDLLKSLLQRAETFVDDI